MQSNNTVLVRWMLGLIGVAFLAIIGFVGSSFSGELKELQKDSHTSKERLSVVETMVDNIRDDVSEIKEVVKENQEQADKIDDNIDTLKVMFMEAEIKRARESTTTGSHHDE